MNFSRRGILGSLLGAIVAPSAVKAAIAEPKLELKVFMSTDEISWSTSCGTVMCAIGEGGLAHDYFMVDTALSEKR